MNTMSIISCKILQDEILWLLSNDPEIKKIIIVENKDIQEFTEKLAEQQVCYDIVPFEEMPPIIEAENGDELTVVVNLLELGLHAVPKTLKSEVYQSIREMIPFSDGMLIFYGLCGNVLGDVEKDFSMEEDGCIVRILRDNDERIVDDCIGATVGGSANYLELLKTHSKEPAFFFTPMYAHAWKEFPLTGYDFDSNPEEFVKLTKMISDLSGYSRVAKVNTGLNYVKDFDKKVEEHAKLFGYSVFEISGNQEIFEKCYHSIKNEISNSN
ncbi:DUF1638 domain-containing protein [Methanolobus sp. ZRKC4]|uniref:DUF1638 domain-containing protein n=1 Tax=Methanolobus sp. ZRKC4 TaxID=3125787 RepID=UPI0032510489